MNPDNILIVEDNEIKRENLENFLRESFPHCEIEFVASLMSAVRFVKKNKPSLILLDMTLPNYDVVGVNRSGGVHPLGGIELLKQIKRKKIPAKVIVFTQYETFGRPPNERDLNDLNSEMTTKFSEYYIGAIYYHATIADWEKQLQNMIEAIQ